MPPVDIAELERLARAATPGPWRVGIPGNFTVYAPDELGELSGPIFGKTCGPRAPENRAYIAAAHPQAILRLCETVREMEGALDAFLDFYDFGDNVPPDHPVARGREVRAVRAVRAALLARAGSEK